jgi:hypothetical protein
MRRTSLTFLVLAILGLTLSCSDDGADRVDSDTTTSTADDADEPGSTTSEPSETGTSTAPPTTADVGDDQARADRAVAAFEALAIAEGFAANGSGDEDEPDDEDDADDIEFVSEECQEFDDAFPDESEDLPGQTAIAESDDLERVAESEDLMAPEEALQLTVIYVDDPARLDDLFALLTDDRLATCMQESMEGSMTPSSSPTTGMMPGPEMGDFEATTTEITEHGDGGIEMAITASMNLLGIPLEIDVTMRFVRDGRAIVLWFSSAFGATGDGLDPDAVFETVLGELAA